MPLAPFRGKQGTVARHGRLATPVLDLPPCPPSWAAGMILGWFTVTRLSPRQRAAEALARCAAPPIAAELQDLAESVVAALLEAGVSVFDLEACADGEDAGVELTVEHREHGPALR